MIWHDAIFIHKNMVVMCWYLQYTLFDNFGQWYVMRADDIRPLRHTRKMGGGANGDEIGTGWGMIKILQGNRFSFGNRVH